MSTTVEYSIPLTFSDLSVVHLGGDQYVVGALTRAGQMGMELITGDEAARDGSWFMDGDSVVVLVRALLFNEIRIAQAVAVSS